MRTDSECLRRDGLRHEDRDAHGQQTEDDDASHSQVRWVIVSGSPTAGGLAGYLKNGTASIANHPPNVRRRDARIGPDSVLNRRA